MHRKIRGGRCAAGAADKATEQTCDFKPGASKVTLSESGDYLDDEK